jgi:hypothetical protein
VRSEREFRAMEVCDLMPDDQTLQLSIKYATRQRHLHLAQRISQLAQQRAQEEGKEEEEEEEEDFRHYLQARLVVYVFVMCQLCVNFQISPHGSTCTHTRMFHCNTLLSCNSGHLHSPTLSWLLYLYTVRARVCVCVCVCGLIVHRKFLFICSRIVPFTYLHSLQHTPYFFYVFLFIL